MYLIVAFLSGNVFLNNQNEYDHGYRIESNRIMSEITDIKQISNYDLSHYQYLKTIDYLNYNETNLKKINDFYLESNTKQIQILPFYQDQQLQGYIKFTYQFPLSNSKKLLIILQMSLLLLEAYILLVLFYLKRKIIKPFQRLTELPLELAKGHYKFEVKEEKSKYFGKFMWSMSQLKDTLDVSQKRQLELMKEKKKLLLSLSHEMKTPLYLIKLYSRALEDDLYSNQEERLHAMKQIGVKADKIESYMEEIIQSSREDILDLHVCNSEFYLSELIEQVLLIYREQCKLRHIDLIVENYENKLLKGDLERSKEVLENILENAFKYGDGRFIKISFVEEDYCQLIQIYNSGLPVSDTEFNHIFESFYRGTNSKGLRGNGLGLYICRELMQKMEGAIFAQKVDEGMTFTLVFR